MTIPRWRTVALAGCVTLGSAAAEAQATRPEWKLVPTMPTSCFKDDGFDGKVVEAGQAAIAAKDQQDALNAKIREQFDKMDMIEKAQRMQAWMMKNPQAASKMLEASAGAGDAAAALTEEVKAAGDRLDQELENHKKAFDTANERAVKPVDARIDELIRTRTRKTQVDAVFISDADYTAYVALIDERNAAYEKACQPFFGAGGAFHMWMAAHRSEVTEKQLAAEANGNAAMAQQFAIMDTPSGGYRTTGGYDVVREHLRRLGEVVAYRAYKTAPQTVLKPRFSSDLHGRADPPFHAAGRRS